MALRRVLSVVLATAALAANSVAGVCALYEALAECRPDPVSCASKCPQPDERVPSCCAAQDEQKDLAKELPALTAPYATLPTPSPSYFAGFTPSVVPSICRSVFGEPEDPLAGGHAARAPPVRD